MARGNIVVSQDAVQHVLKRVRSLIEESQILSNQARRALYEAENMGWKDYSYLKFKDNAENILRKYNESVKEAEEVLIKDLVSLNNSIEGF